MFPLKTSYGSLQIRSSELNELVLTPRLAPGDELAFHKAVSDLADAKYRTREEASRLLKRMGPAVYRRLMRCSTPDAEQALRVDDLLKYCREAYAIPLLNQSEHDRVVTDTDACYDGSVDLEVLHFRSELLGPLTVKLHTIEKISAGLRPFEALVRAGEGWTEIHRSIPAGSRIKIEATGSVDLWPATPGQFMANPAGINQQEAGRLYAKIGNGAEFAPGFSTHLSAPVTGNLFLRIQKSPWGNSSVGHYQVRIVPLR